LIYFITFSNRKFVKIGFSDNPEKRILELQTGNPYKLQLLHVISGNYETEKGFHESLSKYRVRNSEWFKVKGELAASIEALTNPKTKKQIVDLRTFLQLGLKDNLIKKHKRFVRQQKDSKSAKKLAVAVSGSRKLG